MEFEFEHWVDTLGKAVDLVGVLVIVGSVVIFTVMFAYRLVMHASAVQAYRSYRQTLGRGILAGLELLVAADIIRTVAIEPTLRSVAVLAGIVLIRTFLSFTIELEITGRWPWEHKNSAANSS